MVFDAMHAVVAQTLLAAGKKKLLFGPLSMPKNHQFTQTGSGQTEGTLPKRLCRVSCVTEPAFLKKWEQTAREHPGQQLHCSQHCYHLLGVDIIFDDRWHPRVIEVNGEPSMKPGNHTITLLLLRFSCCEGYGEHAIICQDMLRSMSRRLHSMVAVFVGNLVCSQQITRSRAHRTTC